MESRTAPIPGLYGPWGPDRAKESSVRSPGGAAGLVRQEWLAVPGSLACLQRGLGSQPAGLQLLKAPR